MKRRTWTILGIAILLISLSLISAFASEGTILSSPPSGQFSFSLQRGQASSSSAGVKKEDYAAAWITPQSGTITTNDQVAFRIRNSDHSSGTGLYVISNISSFYMYYYSGIPLIETKYLYANAPSTNRSVWVEVSGFWSP